MAVSQANAWLHQAHSDLQSAIKVYDPNDPATFCQAIAKHQQTVEKATKAVAAALIQSGLIREKIRFTHDVSYLLSAFQRLPTSATLHREEAHFAIYHVGSEGEILMDLAPKKTTGALLPRNTEYPYNDPSGGWRSPAEVGSFSQSDVVQFERVASRSLDNAKKIFDGIRRLPNMSGNI